MRCFPKKKSGFHLYLVIGMLAFPECEGLDDDVDEF